MTTKEIRQGFLDFFAAKGHQIVPSAPIVVKNDPTLMFTNAGMNQFKDLFLGEAAIKFPRVADTQRCLRVSGKHNDLEEVGIDTYHHTMFEMLGNWSFGDYFKKEALAWSWELLTEVYKIPKDRLYVSVFAGDDKEGLPKDQEAYDIWKELISEDRILLGNKKDNFWEMGETGPCGPCSEIHVDMRPDSERIKVDGSKLVNQDDPQVIEIWNNVFMQFNRLKNGSLEKLPNQHVDTGMGLERLVRVIQNKTSNYDTDVFQPLIQFISEESRIPYAGDSNPGEEGWGTSVAMRVMADHIRAICFCIADGTLPSNNKAGYVVRRILRRAVRYAYTFLGFKEPFMNKLVPILADQFEGVFPELKKQQDFVQKVVLEEELSFLRTLATGIQRFERFETNDKIIKGDFAFELYDTFGFPIDLTELMAREKGWTVDMKGFEAELQKQKDRSRAATAIDTGDWVIVNEDEEVEFVGYDYLECECRILKYRKVSAKGKDQVQLVLNRTPFYAESGGQAGDSGKLEDHSGLFEYQITDTRKENGLIIHFMDEAPQDPSGSFRAVVDFEKRKATENNHSATHLLHAALKQVLGDHVNQKGSLVNSEYLRFDFSHFSKLSDQELAEVEAIVNRKIRENISLKEQRDVPYQEAVNSGVTALFGEKYGDFVRVITFDDHFSKELCGGTHVKATGQIAYMKIISESAVAAGVRRIEAITAGSAEQYFNNQAQQIKGLKELLKNPNDLLKSVETILEENSRLKKEVEKSILERAAGLKHELVKNAVQINGVNLIAKQVELPNTDAVKNLAYAIKDMINDLFLVLACDIEGKPSLTVMVSENLVKEKNLNAGNIVRELAKEIQGGGGGQPFFATAGGKDSSGLTNALNKAQSFIS
ncbi:alanine--tRNA ligase [Daejeonella sp. H1SJ63]|uniref:alanine--tRNA ligase n=1 Tax=Daejeonella sp. H1SJ63 TaxID=3034145 RepID=UPI0023EDAC48|nr:alanine--tRNA ligase [Daejeonella sp. H1SJ63]